MQPHNGERTLPGGTNTNLIVVVDDDPEFVKVVRKALEFCGYSNPIVHFLDGEPAINFLIQCQLGGTVGRDYPALMFLDMKLPNVSGLEVMRWMKEREMDDIPVIAVSGVRRWGDVAAAYEQGAEFFVSKLENGKLEQKVRHALTVPSGLPETVRKMRRNPYCALAVEEAA